MNSFFSSGDALEALVLGVALAMDAMAVTLSNSLCEPDMPTSKKLAMPVLFALFQMAMPIAGFFGGTLVAPLIEAYAGIVSFAILAFVALIMTDTLIFDLNVVDVTGTYAAVVAGLLMSILVGFLMARRCNRVFGMVNGDILGATNEISRFAVMAIMILVYMVVV